MRPASFHDRRIAPSESTAAAVTALFIDEFERDEPLVSIPRAESHLVARFGPSARQGVDVHAFGARDRAHRKLIRGGQRAVTVRLQLGANEAVLGVSATAIAGRIVPLEDLWGEADARRLRVRLSECRSSVDAARVLDSAIAERLAPARNPRARARLTAAAANRLTRASVNAVADDLGLSERHLRRVFREAVGMSPKSFAKLTRFHRALSAVRKDADASWASIAASAGYYDQAHLIAEFRSIAGVTPRALLRELRAIPSGA